MMIVRRMMVSRADLTFGGRACALSDTSACAGGAASAGAGEEDCQASWIGAGEPSFGTGVDSCAASASAVSDEAGSASPVASGCTEICGAGAVAGALGSVGEDGMGANSPARSVLRDGLCMGNG